MQNKFSLKTYHAWLILVIGLLVSVLVGLKVKQNILDDALSRFEFASAEIAIKIQERLDAHALILQSGVAFFNASDSVDRQDWKTYVDTLRQHESVNNIQGFGFSRLIPADQMDTHVASVQAEGFPDYAVRPADERDVYTSIVYLEPLDWRNMRAMGFDMFSEPVRRDAMEQARDTGKAALSGKVSLVQETDKDVQSGTLMYVPVYRNGAPLDSVEERRSALLGWVYSPYRMGDLMKGILANSAIYEGQEVNLQVFDGLEISAENLLFDSHTSVEGEAHSHPVYNKQIKIEFNGRQWLLVFNQIANQSFFNYLSLWTTMIGGFTVSGLLFSLMLSLLNTTRRANAIAYKLTSEIKSREQKLQLAASVFSTAREGIMITKTDGTILDVNDSFSKITGYSRKDVIGQNSRILSSGRQDLDFYTTLWRDLSEKGYWHGEIWNRRKNGEVYAEMLTITSVRDYENSSHHYVALFSDITSIKEYQNQLENIAHYDVLTRLPNRALLSDRLLQAMAQARRSGKKLAVVFLDLDGFKAVNDNHGHQVGDELLITLAMRLKGAVREGDTLARIGGDEFVATMLDLQGNEDSFPMLSRLLAAVAEPVRIGDLTLQVSASLGVTFYPQEEELDADQLQRQADQAMYQAKLAGKNRYHVFDEVQDRSLRGHHENIDDIRRALANREFKLYYQPKVDMRSGTVVGAEALIRWQHPEKGLLLPAAFLPIIESHPLSIDIGEWVIDTALTQIESWRLAGLDIPVSVNVGGHQLQHPNFLERLRRLLIAHPSFRQGDLEIEVLETSALADIAWVSRVIRESHKLGVNFALDDFGTGYSSLTYLKSLAVTVLKVDQSFVRDILDDSDDLAILTGVIGLANAFRCKVIAEGVETEEHGEMLLKLGCTLAQGYGIAHPMPAEQMLSWSVSWRSPSVWINTVQVSQKSLALLYAEVEHRAFVKAVTDYLKGEREFPVLMDSQECRFSLWLEAERTSGELYHLDFQVIKDVHLQVHSLADELCKLHADGMAAESLQRIDELHALRKLLLGHINALIKNKNSA